MQHTDAPQAAKDPFIKVRAGTGLSSEVDAAVAAKEAAAAALRMLEGEPAALVIVYATPNYDYAELLAAIRRETGDTLLVGATSLGHFACGQFAQRGVAIMAMTAGPYGFGAASVSEAKGKLDESAQQLAREGRAAAGPSKYGAVLLLADGLIGDHQELIQGMYRVTGPRIPIVGGCTADELQFQRTVVFHNDKVVEHGAVAVWIASDAPLRVVTRHGWQPLGVPMFVTRTDGVEVMEIGGRPAAVVYEEQLGLAPGALTIEFWATSQFHPFGVLQPDGSLVIRAGSDRTPQDTIVTRAPIPAGSAVQIMQGNADMLLESAAEVAAAALADRGDEVGVLLTWSCGLRQFVLGERTHEEPQRLQAAAGDVPTFGFYTYGEFARTNCVLGSHQATLTAIAL